MVTRGEEYRAVRVRKTHRKPARHPQAVAWVAYTDQHPETFDVTTLGTSDVYLTNRIKLAFIAGWEACLASQQPKRTNHQDTKDTKH